MSLAILVGSTALAVRWPLLQSEPLTDELWQVLAARGLEASGELAITPGAEPYARTAFLTRLIAAFMATFGDNLAAARLPSIIWGVLTVGVLSAWLARRVCVGAGLLAGVLLAFDPLHIQLSTIVRFYSPLILCFLIGVITLHDGYREERPVPRTLLFLSAALSFGVCVYLQRVAIVALGGVGLFVIGDLLMRDRQWNLGGLRHPVRWAVGTGVGLAIAVVFVGGFWDDLVALATFAPQWASANVSNPRYYYAQLYGDYAPLVAMMPLLAGVAIVRQPRIGILMSTVFAVAFLVQSGLAWKAERYLSHVYPMFFVLAGMGLWELAKQVVALAHRLGQDLTNSRRTWASWGFLVVVILAFAVGQRSFLSAVRLMTRDSGSHYAFIAPNEGPVSWSRASEQLGAAVDSADVVVSTEALKALYFFNRLDYALSRNLVTTWGSGEEFYVDDRFGRPVISTEESLRSLARIGSVLVVAQTSILRNTRATHPEVFEFLRANGTPVELTGNTGISAYWLSSS